MAYQKIIIQGNLTKDVAYKDTGETAIASFTVAVSGYKEGEVEFFYCKAFKKTAEIANRFLAKGSPVLLECTRKTSKYTRDGVEKTSVEYIVQQLVLLGSKKEDNSDLQPNPAVQDDQEADIPF